jgi:hypothetical protein
MDFFNFSNKEWEQIKEICMDKQSHYNRFFIDKSDGKRKRMILAPDKELKGLQNKLLNEFIYVHFIPSAFATGFVVDRSIVDNAMVHVGSKIVVNIDIKDFFPSVTFDMLYEKLLDRAKKLALYLKKKKKMKEKNVRYEHELNEIDAKLSTREESEVAKKCNLLANLCTYPYVKKIYVDNNGEKKKQKLIVNALPQGAPTSPALSNIVCFDMDNIMSGIAERNNSMYTRYADDLTFSSSENAQLNKIIPIIKETLEKYKFTANERKIHVNRRSGRMSVTGLVVNDKVSYGRGRLRIIRAILHNAKMKVIKDKQLIPFDEMHFRGLAAYINSFDPKKAAVMNQEIDLIVDGLKELKE